MKRGGPLGIDAPLLTESQLVALAEYAEHHVNELSEVLVKIPSEIRSKLLQETRKLSASVPKHRNLLKYIRRSIERAEEIEPDRFAEAEDREYDLAHYEEHRDQLRSLVGCLYLGDLVGSTQTINYKAQGNKSSFGTRRKRRK